MFTLRNIVDVKNGSPLLAQEDRVVSEPTVMRLIVTPEQATEWLQKNARNRRLRQHKVDQYARDMKAGHWNSAFCDPIAFNVNGDVLNGQHRLWAIVESGVTLPLWVQFNVPNESQMFMDGCITRRNEDYERINNPDLGVTTLMCAVVNSMKYGLRGGPGAVGMSKAEHHEFLVRHLDAVRFAVGLFPSHIKKVSTAPLLAVLARASYSQSHDAIKVAATILRTCEPPDDMRPGWRSIIRLRKWMEEFGSGGASVMREHYSRTERALVAFLAGQDLQVNRGVDREHFPLPEEHGK